MVMQRRALPRSPHHGQHRVAHFGITVEEATGITIGDGDLIGGIEHDLATVYGGDECILDGATSAGVIPHGDSRIEAPNQREKASGSCDGRHTTSGLLSAISYSSNRLTASVTLCPPKPNEFDNATFTS